MISWQLINETLVYKINSYLHVRLFDAVNILAYVWFYPMDRHMCMYWLCNYEYADSIISLSLRIKNLGRGGSNAVEISKIGSNNVQNGCYNKAGLILKWPLCEVVMPLPSDETVLQYSRPLFLQPLERNSCGSRRNFGLDSFTASILFRVGIRIEIPRVLLRQ